MPLRHRLLAVVSLSGSFAIARLVSLFASHPVTGTCAKQLGEGRDPVGLLDKLLKRNPPKDAAKLGRNDLCWCGSGKKYKKCHYAADQGHFARLRSERRPSRG